MITNVWYSLREDFDYESEKNIEHLRGAHDREVVSSLFKQESFGGFDWTLTSVWYQVDSDAEVQAQVDALSADNPDQVRVLQSNYAQTGYPLGTQDQETGAFTYEPPVYPQYVDLLAYMPDVGDPPQPATELADVNLLLGQVPRELTFLTTLTPIVLRVQQPVPGFWFLFWRGPLQDVDGFQVYRDDELFGATTANAFFTVRPGEYTVRAVRDDKRSVPSNAVTVS